MLIVSKDKKAIVNMAAVSSIYMGHDNCSVKVDYQNGKGCQLGRYNSERATQIAMDMLVEKIGIGKTEIFFMPDDKDIDAKLANESNLWHHATGKKTKGHGGS